LLSVSSLCVPEVRVGVEKHWWSLELEDLKHECMEQTNIWRLNGCPRSGIFSENRINAKLRYKCAIKEAVISADKDFNEDLVNHKNFNGFWKALRKRFCSEGFPVLLCGIHSLAVLFVFIVECVKVEFSHLCCLLYVDDFISELRQSGYGLHIGSLFIGSIL